jgi:hypothetical protein
MNTEYTPPTGREAMELKSSNGSNVVTGCAGAALDTPAGEGTRKSLSNKSTGFAFVATGATGGGLDAVLSRSL